MGKDGFVLKKIEKDTQAGEHHAEQDTERHRERPRDDDRGRDWSEASICQGSLVTPAAGGRGLGCFLPSRPTLCTPGLLPLEL